MREEVLDAEEATLAGRGGMTGVAGIVRVRKSARETGLGVIDPGVVTGEDTVDWNLDLIGDVLPRTVMEDPVDCRGRVIGVTKPVDVPEMVRARK